MKTNTYTINFITPCFCAAADQAIAEVRAPSIRGKLRWWFRVLGGNRSQEAEIFGSITGGLESASRVIIRVSDVAMPSQWQPIRFSQNSSEAYLLYYATVSAEGKRWKQGGAIPTGASFKLSIFWRQNVSKPAKEVFELAMECFLMLGSLGLRSTRGMGSFETKEIPFSEPAFNALIQKIKKYSSGFIAGLGEFDGPENLLLKEMGRQLRGLRSDGYSAGPPGRANLNPLGSSQPRQASAVYLRPVRTAAENYRIVLFEVPAERVLAVASRQGAPRLGGGIPVPKDPPQRSRRY